MQGEPCLITSAGQAGIQFRVVIEQFSDKREVRDFKENAECRGEGLCRTTPLVIAFHNFMLG